MHMEGKTEQARKDLERLAIVRKEREEAAAKKKAESEGAFHLAFILPPLFFADLMSVILQPSKRKLRPEKQGSGRGLETNLDFVLL